MSFEHTAFLKITTSLLIFTSLVACSTSGEGQTGALEEITKERQGYKNYTKAKKFYAGKSVVPTNGGYAFYLSPSGVLSSVPQNRKFTVNSTSLSDLPPLTVALVSGKSFRGAPHKDAIITNRVFGKDAICSQEVTIFGKDDPICLPLYHDKDGSLFEPAFNSKLVVFDGPDAFKAAVIDYAEDGNLQALYRLTEVFPNDKAISARLEKRVAEAKAAKAAKLAQKQEQVAPRTSQSKSRSSGSGLLGALLMGALKTISGTSQSSQGGTSSASADYRPNYEYVIKCRDRRLFGADVRTELSLGMCRGYESECEQKLYDQINTSASITSYCSKRLGSEFVTDRIARKGT